MTWRIDLSRAEDTATVDEVIRPDRIIAPEFQLEPSAVSSWSAEVPYSESLEDWGGDHARVYFERDDGDDELIIRGPIVTVESDDDNGTTVIQGHDVVEELRRGRDARNGLVFDVEADAAHEAIRRFYDDSRFQFWDTTVHDPDPEMQVSNEIIQQGVDFQDVFDPPDDEPVAADPDAVRLDPVTRFREAEAVWEGTIASAPRWSGGEAALMESTDQFVEMTVNLLHDIPDGEVGIAVRADSTDGSAPNVEFRLDDSPVDTFTGWMDGENWWKIGDGTFAGDGWSGGLDAGQHTLRVEVTDGGASDDQFYYDCFAIYDQRYVPQITEWDNSPDTAGALDDPPLYPPEDYGVTVDADEVSQEWNIVNASLRGEVDGGDYPRRLAFDFGGGWVGYSDVEHVSGHNGGYPTTSMQARVRLGADRSLDGQTETPKFNYEASNLERWELSIDGNDLPVINNTTYSGNYLEVCQELHDDANMLFVAEYHRDGKGLDSFQPGDVTREADWTRQNHSRELDLTDYANRIRAIGAKWTDGGDRREVTVEHRREIEAFGEAIEGDPVIMADETDFEKLRTEARSALADAVLTREMTGEIDVAPTAIAPGYSYPVPALSDDPADPQLLTLWSVSFSDESGSLSFGKPDDLASALATLRSEVNGR